VEICHVEIEIEAISVMEQKEMQVFGTSTLPHFLNNRFRGGGEVLSLTPRPRFTAEKNCWCQFLLEALSNPGPWCG
jgi:hypothetical protein